MKRTLPRLDGPRLDGPRLDGPRLARQKGSVTLCFYHILAVLWLLALLPAYGQQRKSMDFTARITKYRQALNTARQDSARAKLCFQLADMYSVINIDSAAFFASQGIRSAEKLPNKVWLVSLYGELGRSYNDMGKPTEALATLKKAEALGQRYVKDSTTAKIQLMLATFYHRRSDHALALSKALAALRHYETNRLDRTSFLCKIYTNLGLIYSDLNDFPKALHYYDKLQEVGKTFLGGYYVYMSLINSADIYYQQKEYPKAEVAARAALAKARELNNNRGISFGLGNLADILFKTGRHKEALDYASQALHIRQQMADKRLIGYSLISMAEISAALDQNQQALTYAKQGVATLRGTNDRGETRRGLSVLGQLYEKTSDYSNALLTLKAEKLLNDSLMNVENAREVSRIQGSFDLERKQNQITLLNKNLAIQRLEAGERQKQLQLMGQERRTTDLQNQLLIRKQELSQSKLAVQAVIARRQSSLISQQQTKLTFARQQQLLYITIVVLLIGIIALLTYFFRRQQMARNLLNAQNEEIQQQALRLIELNATKDKLFSLISHDLRGPIAHLKQNFYRLRNNTPATPVLSTSLRQLEAQVDNILELLTNLLDWSHSQLKGFQSHPQAIDLAEVMADMISQLSDQINHKSIGLINQIARHTYVQADRHQLHSILRNLLGNAVKFTPREGFIRVRTDEIAGQIELIIQDTGIGMTADELARMLTDPAVRTGTEGEPSTGLGLRLSQDLLDRQGGSLTVASQPRKGTTVRVRLPRGSTAGARKETKEQTGQ